MRGFGLIGVIIGVVLMLVVGGGVYYLKLKNTGPTPVDGPQSCPPGATYKGGVCFIGGTPKPCGANNKDEICSIVDETTNLLTYSNSEAKFSIQYPVGWSVNTQPEQCNAGPTGKNCTNLVGKEGDVDIKWGSGFGGGCDQSEIVTVNINNESVDSCHTINQDGSEVWGTINKHNASTDQSFILHAQANKLSETNKDLILKVLSTFKFTN